MTDTRKGTIAVETGMKVRASELVKWLVMALIGVLSFIVTAFVFPRLNSLEVKTHETEKKVERMDQKLDDLKTDVTEIKGDVKQIGSAVRNGDNK